MRRTVYAKKKKKKVKFWQNGKVEQNARFQFSSHHLIIKFPSILILFTLRYPPFLPLKSIRHLP
jgi:hypothetical protein